MKSKTSGSHILLLQGFMLRSRVEIEIEFEFEFHHTKAVWESWKSKQHNK